jgi:adenosine kinase
MRVLSWSLNNDNTINRHEYNISMLGSVGEDLYKDKIINALDDIGVNPILEILKNDKTSRCGVGVYQKEKLFVTQLRASKRLSEKYIEDNLDKILEHQALIIEGYLLNNKFDLVKKICDYFIQNKKLVILTLSASFIVKIRLNEIIELGNKADIIVGSMEEAKEFPSNNIFNTPEDVFKNIFLKLTPKENRILLITDGPNGAYCTKYNYDTNEFSYKIHIPANKIKDEEIKDLNGAGDAFLGGFLAEYMKGSNIKDCCKNGINAATINIQNVGCTFPKKFNFQKN